MIGSDQTAALTLRTGPVFLTTSPDDPGTIEALIVQATLAGHRSVQAARVLNGWVVAALDE